MNNIYAKTVHTENCNSHDLHPIASFMRFGVLFIKKKKNTVHNENRNSHELHPIASLMLIN